MIKKYLPMGDELYKKGLECSFGEKQDLLEAHKWFNLAAMQGSKEALLSRGEIALELSNEDIYKAQKLAREYLKNMKEKNTPCKDIKGVA